MIDDLIDRCNFFFFFAFFVGEVIPSKPKKRKYKKMNHLRGSRSRCSRKVVQNYLLSGSQLRLRGNCLCIRNSEIRSLLGEYGENEYKMEYECCVWGGDGSVATCKLHVHAVLLYLSSRNDSVYLFSAKDSTRNCPACLQRHEAFRFFPPPPFRILSHGSL